MAETLIPTDHSVLEPVDLETFRSRLKELSATRIDDSDPSESPLMDPNKVIEDWTIDFEGSLDQIELEEPDISNLGPADLEEYLEQLRKEMCLTEEQNMKIDGEVGALSRKLAEESAVLDGNLEALASSLELIYSRGLHFEADIQYGRVISGDTHESPIHISEDYTFRSWELDQQLEKSKSNLTDLQELDYASRRVETIGQIEDTLSAAKVIEFKGNCIRLSLRTAIPISDGLLLRHKLDCLKEPHVLDHELLIEVDSSMEPNNVEIFPGDVTLEEIVSTVKSSKHLLIPLTGSSLGWLIRQVQHRILLCGLRRLLVKDANTSRHSFEYSDGDEMITAHLVGGIDAFIKISQTWPLSGSALKLVSVKNTDVHSKSISLSFLCKIEELVNSLEVQKRQNIASFLDAIEEILIREMHSQLQLDNTCT